MTIKRLGGVFGRNNTNGGTIEGTVTNDLDFGDNVKATFGASGDMWIYHDGGSSYVYDRGTGNLRIITNSTVSIDGASGGEFMAQFVSNGAVTLYFDNSAKIATSSTGVTVTGNVVVTGTVDGRDIATDGTKLDGIEAGADVTDTANVTAAGALMDSELTDIAAVKALNQGVATTDSPSFAGLTAATADINGGTIDGTVIGGASAATISGTTISATSPTSTSADDAFFGQDASSNRLFQVRGDGAFSTGIGTLSPYNLVTGNAANVLVDSDGYLYRSTSSLKYKTKIQDATHGLAEVMALRPVTYKSNRPDASGNVPDAVYGGLIAEEVHDAGLTEFVQYADDGTPDALSYGNMVALCIKAIQQQQAIIEVLEARVAALEA